MYVFSLTNGELLTSWQFSPANGSRTIFTFKTIPLEVSQFGGTFSRHQSQPKFPRFQHMQMLPHQKPFLTTKQMSFLESRSPPLQDSITHSRLSWPHQLPWNHGLPVTPLNQSPAPSFCHFFVTTSMLLIPWANHPISLWIMGELLPHWPEHATGAFQLWQCFQNTLLWIAIYTPKPNTGDLMLPSERRLLF